MANDPFAGLDEYEYTDLTDPENIRLLAVRSAPKDADLIDCTLFECDLKDAKYEALSWCWGDRLKTRKIQISDSTETKSLAIPENLYEGLKALRLDKKVRNLWVDAVCIHQNNVQERNKQVPRMDQIYGNASNVCIWLGPPDHLLAEAKVKKAFNFVDKLLKLWNLDNLLEKESDIESWEALLDVMKRPWFSRRWVVQEISLAKEATIHCGSYKAPWDDFADAVSLFVQFEETTQKLSKLAKLSKRFDSSDDRFEEVHRLGASLLVKTTKDLFRRSTWGRHYKQLTLESLVSRLAPFQSKQPRDTIYGLLAMARDTQPYADEALRYLDPTERELIERVAAMFPSSRKARYEVNYETPTIDVYQEFIAFSIRNADPTRALDIICRPFAYTYTKADDHAFNEQKLKAMRKEEKAEIVQLPTWIPVVDHSPFAMQSADRNPDGSETGNFFNHRMRRQNGDSFVGPPEARNYSAAGSRRFDKSKLAFRKSQYNYYSMFTEGFVLDTVKKTAGVATTGRIPHAWFRLIGWTDRHNGKAPPNEAKFDQFWRAMVANRDHRGVDPPIYYKRACETVFKDFTAASGFKTDEYINRGGAIAEYLRQVEATIWERQLIETTEEGRLGLGDRSVEDGDRICILYGCSVPVIMKRVKKDDLDVKREKEEDEAEVYRRRQLAATKLKEIRDKHKKPKATSIPTIRKPPAPPDGKESQTARGSNPHSQQPAMTDEEKQRRLKVLDDQLAAYRKGKKAQQPSLDRLWAWLYRSRHVGRTLLLIAVATWIEYRGDTATANLIRLAAATYFTTYSSSTFVDPSTQWMISILGAVIITLLIAYSAILYSDRTQVTWDTAAVYLTFVTAFPQVLPSPFRRTFNRARDRLERVLDDIQESAEKKSERWRDSLIRTCGIILKRFRKLRRVVPRIAPRAKYYYRIVGECYIHGMMEGEAIEWQNQRRIKSEIFEIR